MKTLGIVIVSIIVVIGLAVAIPGCAYNRVVKLSQNTDSAWAQVQNVYQRRADLIPNLIATVSGSANFEKSTLEAVTNARASVGKVQINANSAPTDSATLAEYERSQGALSSALSRLLVVAERYPDLKSTAGFRDLQVQLEGTENRISVERGKFNESINSYNSAIKSFPANLVAGSFGFKDKPYFSAAPVAQTPPQVQFDFGNPKPATKP